MAHHHPPEVDPKDIERAATMWDAFVQKGKYATILTCALLVLLALMFVNFS